MIEVYFLIYNFYQFKYLSVFKLKIRRIHGGCKAFTIFTQDVLMTKKVYCTFVHFIITYLILLFFLAISSVEILHICIFKNISIFEYIFNKTLVPININCFCSPK
jgi:hypothetical protein